MLLEIPASTRLSSSNQSQADKFSGAREEAERILHLSQMKVDCFQKFIEKQGRKMKSEGGLSRASSKYYYSSASSSEGGVTTTPKFYPVRPYATNLEVSAFTLKLLPTRCVHQRTFLLLSFTDMSQPEELQKTTSELVKLHSIVPSIEDVVQVSLNRRIKFENLQPDFEIAMELWVYQAEKKEYDSVSSSSSVKMDSKSLICPRSPPSSGSMRKSASRSPKAKSLKMSPPQAGKFFGKVSKVFKRPSPTKDSKSHHSASVKEKGRHKSENHLSHQASTRSRAGSEPLIRKSFFRHFGRVLLNKENFSDFDRKQFSFDLEHEEETPLEKRVMITAHFEQVANFQDNVGCNLNVFLPMIPPRWDYLWGEVQGKCLVLKRYLERVKKKKQKKIFWSK